MKGTSYYDLAVYHAADGSYIVHWIYSGRRDGDIAHHEVGKFTDLEGAIDALETFNPVQWLAEPATQTDQSRVRERYEAQVSALCEELDVAEEW
jgi:L-ascorbate metabolism protein UlaG (beta-lactamase superfamily)